MNGMAEEARTTEREDERRGMVAAVDEMMRFTASATGRERLSERVRAALDKVPRHRFVPEDDAANAYLHVARPIGRGQTISQPYIVALMTELAELGPADSVLEIGTGCGYQAAMLAEVAGRVYSVECVGELADAARQRLERLGYRNVEIRSGDGWAGWPEHAPYRAILVTAAAREVPPPLLEQLAPGGRLVLPLGRPWQPQSLVVVEKDDDGVVHERDVLPVAFVPLVHED
jgi:protein-L-isoaspartate(D-aspartate) O-methyltransferase